MSTYLPTWKSWRAKRERKQQEFLLRKRSKLGLRTGKEKRNFNKNDQKRLLNTGILKSIWTSLETKRTVKLT